MSGDMAIRYGQELPKGYQKMKWATCNLCRETLWIVHQLQFMDVKRAMEQSKSVQGILEGEHADRNYKNHHDRYELD